MPDDTVAVVIPSVRNAERLRGCVRAAREIAVDDGVEIEMVVVLDGADPDVSQFVAAEVGDATVLSWSERRGFAAAINAAGRTTESVYLAILQDDARPQPGWLRSLVGTATRNPAAGVVGSLVLGSDGSVRRAGSIIGGDGYTADRWIGPPPPRDHIVDEVCPVDYVSSSSLLIRRAAWEAVGGFDEEMYPVVYVDADFCTALWNTGWSVLLDPGSVVVHDVGGSTSNRFRDFLYKRNHERFVAKWGPCFVGRPSYPTGQGDPNFAGQPGSWYDESTSPRDGPVASHPIEAPASVYVQRERDLLGAYVAELEVQIVALAASHEELVTTRGELTQVHEELRPRPWSRAGRWIRRGIRRP